MDRLVELNNDEEFRYIVSQEEDAKLTEKLLQDYAKMEGIQQRNIEIAKKMLEDGLDVNTIIKYSGLSKEELEALKK